MGLRSVKDKEFRQGYDYDMWEAGKDTSHGGHGA